MFIESNERECSPMPMSDARQDLRIVSHKFQFNYIAAGKMTDSSHSIDKYTEQF